MLAYKNSASCDLKLSGGRESQKAFYRYLVSEPLPISSERIFLNRPSESEMQGVGNFSKRERATSAKYIFVYRKCLLNDMRKTKV